MERTGWYGTGTDLRNGSFVAADRAGMFLKATAMLTKAKAHRALAWLDAVFSHNAIVAMLSASLALGATWWLDSRAQARANDDVMRVQAGEIVAAVALARGRLTLALSNSSVGIREKALHDAHANAADFTGTYAVTVTRLLRSLRLAGAGEDLPVALDVIPDELIPALAVLQRCAGDRVRGTAPDIQCQLASVLSNSMATCEIAVLIAMDATISRPDRAASLHQEAEALCLAQPGLPIEN